MAINKYPATSPTVAVSVAVGSFSNGAAADQVNANAANAAVFVLSTNVSLSSGVYNVSASGSLTGRTLSLTTAVGNGTYVYISTSATQFYTYAPATWTTRGLTWNTSGSMNRAVTLGYGNGKYLAAPNLSANYTLKSSTDGITWTTAGAQAIVAQGALKYLNNLWVAVPGITSATNIFTSADGVTWSSRNGLLGSTQTANDVAYGNGVYVLTGSANGSTSTNVTSSTDGITWVTKATLFWASSSVIKGIIYGAAGFLASGNVDQTVYTSTNAITWVTRNASTGGTGIAAMTYANGLYMVVDANQGTAVSTDTITWTIKTAYSSAGLSISVDGVSSAIVWNSGIYGLISRSGNGALYASTDGSNWITKSISSISPYGIIYGDKWVVVGSGSDPALAATSTDISGPVTNAGAIIWERKATANGVF